MLNIYIGIHILFEKKIIGAISRYNWRMVYDIRYIIYHSPGISYTVYVQVNIVQKCSTYM